MTALTLGPINTLDTTLTSAYKLVTTGGSTSYAGPTVYVTSTGWGEVAVNGSTSWSGGGTGMGDPTGNGYIFDVTTLNGRTIPAGIWTVNFRAYCTSSSNLIGTGTFFWRLYKYTVSSATYTRLDGGSSTSSPLTVAALAIDNTASNYSLTGNVPACSFGAGEKLYIDVWLHLTSGANGDGRLRWQVSSNATNYANVISFATPGHVATPTTHTSDATGRSRTTKQQGHPILGRSRTVKRVTRTGTGRASLSKRQLKQSTGRSRSIRARARNTLGRALIAPYTGIPRTRGSQGRIIFHAGGTTSASALFKMMFGSTQRWTGRARVTTLAITHHYLTVTVNNETVSIANDSFSYDKQLGSRSTATFTILDETGTLDLPNNATVTIVDSIDGIIYAGFVDTYEKVNLYPHATNAITVTCKDNRYRADKRRVLHDYRTMPAGAIVIDMLDTILKYEGVRADYAISYDRDFSSWDSGTHLYTQAYGNTLRLLPVGFGVNSQENTTDQFATGVLTNLVAANNQLTLASVTGIKATGVMTSNTTLVQSHTRVIWEGSAGATNEGDFFQYDIWLHPNSPGGTSAVEVYFEDGSQLTIPSDGTAAPTDQYGLPCTPDTSLAPYAQNTWYRRMIALPANKTIMEVAIVLAGTIGGTYQVFVKSLCWTDSEGSIIGTFAPRTNRVRGNVGFVFTSVNPTTLYETVGTRVTPVYDTTDVSIIRDSLLTWTEYIPDQMKLGFMPPPAVTPPAQVEVTYDGGYVWTQCKNNLPLPGMYAGLWSGVLTLQFRITLAAAVSPEYTPRIQQFLVQLLPSSFRNSGSPYMVSDFDHDSAFLSGTLSNVAVIDGKLMINGAYRSFADGNISDITLYGGPLTRLLSVLPSAKLQANANADARARLLFSGNWQNFACEFDLFLPDTNAFAGLVYKTGNWQDTPGTYGYAVSLNGDTVQLTRGNNSSFGPGEEVLLASTELPESPIDGGWFRVSVTVSGITHSVAINGNPILQTDDATYALITSNVALYQDNRQNPAMHTCCFANFGIQDGTFTGSRIHPPLALTNLQTLQGSLISWKSDTNNGASAVNIDVSYDFSTWLPCTNNAPVPGYTFNDIATGRVLYVRETLSTGNANISPSVSALFVLFNGAFASIGTRTSDPLSLSDVLYAGTSFVVWVADVLSPATCTVKGSRNGGSTWISLTNDAALPTTLLTISREPYLDYLLEDTSASYTQTFLTGGDAATWIWDSTHHTITATAGVYGILTYTADTPSLDSSIEADIRASDSGGLVVRMVDSDNAYLLLVSDSANASTTPDRVALYRMNGGVLTQISQDYPFHFLRGDLHRYKLVISGTLLTACIDGEQVLSVIDTSIVAAGTCGLIAGLTTGETLVVAGLRILVEGENLLGQTISTQLTLTTTNPGVQPVVQSLLVSVTSPSIEAGALIPQTTYKYEKTVAQALDDLADQSGNFIWTITDDLRLEFHAREAKSAPFSLWTSTNAQEQNGNILAIPLPKVSRPDMLYRNRQIIDGVLQILGAIIRTLPTDGTKQEWTLDYATAFGGGAPLISLNGINQTVGLRGVDQGYQFYYDPGTPLITQDQYSIAPGEHDVLTINYVGQQPMTLIHDNLGQYPGTISMQQMAVIDGTSGLVEDYIKADNISAQAALQLANGLLQQYGRLGHVVTLQTLWEGITPAHLTTVSLPQYGLWHTPMLVTAVRCMPHLLGTGSLVYYYEITLTEGPVLGDWSKLFAKMITK